MGYVEKHKYRMIKKAGALQDAFQEAPQSLSSTSNTGYDPYDEIEQQQAFFDEEAFPISQMAGGLQRSRSNSRRLPRQQVAMAPVAQQRAHMNVFVEEPEAQHFTGLGTQEEPTRRPSLMRQSDLLEGHSMSWFSYTVAEGQRVLAMDKKGRGEILIGPCRVPRKGRKFHVLQHHVAYPGEFLIVRFKDGSQKHLPGPSEIWLDPRAHSDCEKEDALQISAKESVVVYSKQKIEKDGEEKEEVQRRIVSGPALFVPEPGEWLHTFCWHGSKGQGYKKLPGGMVFQKLWQMPDQMYHDVEEVRTSDDVILTIKLMIFFELVDVEKMLDATHDPIGDFINATSSDVLDLVGRCSFDEFKTQTDKLNDRNNYTQLLGRAEQIGYRINKLVSRGYSTTAALQSMHEQAIETRTRLKLEKETERQSQELADFKQSREYQRASKSRAEELERQEHKLEVQKRSQLELLELEKQKLEFSRDQDDLNTKAQLEKQAKDAEQRLSFIKELKDMGVDLTSYLTQNRADKVFEFRAGEKAIAPHIHLSKSDEL